MARASSAELSRLALAGLVFVVFAVSLWNVPARADNALDRTVPFQGASALIASTN